MVVINAIFDLKKMGYEKMVSMAFHTVLNQGTANDWLVSMLLAGS